MSISDQIIYGTVDSVRASLQHVKELDVIDEYGYTPLIQTAIVNNPDMTRALIEAGADYVLDSVMNIQFSSPLLSNFAFISI